jgi:ABC-type proline/glycine betaine transport system ATPase subunit
MSSLLFRPIDILGDLIAEHLAVLKPALIAMADEIRSRMATPREEFVDQTIASGRRAVRWPRAHRVSYRSDSIPRRTDLAPA